jgi:BexC/CtrB/KpsE family polysaccharide export inner-membrane protein
LKKSEKKVPFFVRIFQLIVWLIGIAGFLSIPYWLLIASDRYVSEARVLLQKTDQLSGLATGGLASIVSGSGGPNRGDQLLLREYLLSVDMLKKLDAAFDLRTHYSDTKMDFISRMWFEDPQMERFYRYWLSRVDVVYDDYSGVLNIRAEAYDPQMAQDIVDMLIKDGESHMNRIAHELAQIQVQFLASQVTLTHDRLLNASHALIEFQNKQGLVSPKEQVESLSILISKLEAQRTDIQTQLDSLPASLNENHPTILMLKKSLKSIDGQITKKRDFLTSPARRTLNYKVEEFQRLEMELGFVQDVYKTALSGLERGRTDASRTLKKISVFQSPTVPDFPLAPRRPYNTLVSLLIAGALASIVKLMESIIRDHVD